MVESSDILQREEKFLPPPTPISTWRHNLSDQQSDCELECTLVPLQSVPRRIKLFYKNEDLKVSMSNFQHPFTSFISRLSSLLLSLWPQDQLTSVEIQTQR